MTDDEQRKRARDGWEQFVRDPSPPPLDELWDRVALAEEQRAVLDKYKKQMRHMVQRVGYRWWRLADQLLALESDKVTGNKPSFIKKLLGRHQGLELRARKNGFSIGQKSSEFYDVRFELEILRFLVSTSWTIELADEKHGEKTPEFRACKADFSMDVEAKCIDTDNQLDIDLAIAATTRPDLQSMVPQTLAKLSVEQLHKRRTDAIRRQHDGALAKFDDSTGPHVVFLSAGWHWIQRENALLVQLVGQWESPAMLGLAVIAGTACTACDKDLTKCTCELHLHCLANPRSKTNLADILAPRRGLASRPHVVVHEVKA